mmetsp:Transcript_20604/g.52409  ORF Transcript_20604/g.52409 Transcript_20604/m.52409 type:complete len:295 (-) Transcript_20604:966-1850(-)
MTGTSGSRWPQPWGTQLRSVRCRRPRQRARGTPPSPARRPRPPAYGSPARGHPRATRCPRPHPGPPQPAPARNPGGASETWRAVSSTHPGGSAGVPAKRGALPCRAPRPEWSATHLRRHRSNEAGHKWPADCAAWPPQRPPMNSCARSPPPRCLWPRSACLAPGKSTQTPARSAWLCTGFARVDQYPQKTALGRAAPGLGPGQRTPAPQAWHDQAAAQLILLALQYGRAKPNKSHSQIRHRQLSPHQWDGNPRTGEEGATPGERQATASPRDRSMTPLPRCSPTTRSGTARRPR